MLLFKIDAREIVKANLCNLCAWLPTLRATCPSAHAPRCRDAYHRDLQRAHALEPVCPLTIGRACAPRPNNPVYTRTVGFGPRYHRDEASGRPRAACVRPRFRVGGVAGSGVEGSGELAYSCRFPLTARFPALSACHERTFL